MIQKIHNFTDQKLSVKVSSKNQKVSQNLKKIENLINLTKENISSTEQKIQTLIESNQRHEQLLQKRYDFLDLETQTNLNNKKAVNLEKRDSYQEALKNHSDLNIPFDQFFTSKVFFGKKYTTLFNELLNLRDIHKEIEKKHLELTNYHGSLQDGGDFQFELCEEGGGLQSQIIQIEDLNDEISYLEDINRIKQQLDQALIKNLNHQQYIQNLQTQLKYKNQIIADKIKNQASKIDSAFEIEECFICIDQIGINLCSNLGKTFHKDCLSKFLSKQDQCHLCDKSINREQITPKISKSYTYGQKTNSTTSKENRNQGSNQFEQNAMNNSNQDNAKMKNENQEIRSDKKSQNFESPNNTVSSKNPFAPQGLNQNPYFEFEGKRNKSEPKQLFEFEKDLTSISNQMVDKNDTIKMINSSELAKCEVDREKLKFFTPVLEQTFSISIINQSPIQDILQSTPQKFNKSQSGFLTDRTASVPVSNQKYIPVTHQNPVSPGEQKLEKRPNAPFKTLFQENQQVQDGIASDDQIEPMQKPQKYEIKYPEKVYSKETSLSVSDFSQLQLDLGQNLKPNYSQQNINEFKQSSSFKVFEPTIIDVQKNNKVNSKSNNNTPHSHFPSNININDDQYGIQNRCQFDKSYGSEINIERNQLWQSSLGQSYEIHREPTNLNTSKSFQDTLQTLYYPLDQPFQLSSLSSNKLTKNFPDTNDQQYNYNRNSQPFASEKTIKELKI